MFGIVPNFTSDHKKIIRIWDKITPNRAAAQHNSLLRKIKIAYNSRNRRASNQSVPIG